MFGKKGFSLVKLIIAILIIGIALSSIYFFFLKKDVQVVWSECNDDLSRYLDGKPGIYESEWTSEETLNVYAYGRLNCTYSLIEAKKSIDHDKLTIYYKELLSDDSGSCECTKTMNFTITDIEKKDYTIEIKRQ